MDLLHGEANFFAVYLFYCLKSFLLLKLLGFWHCYVLNCCFYLGQNNVYRLTS